LSLFAQERVIASYNIFWYLISTIICIVLVALFIVIGSQLTRAYHEKELMFAISSGILYGIATIYLKAMTIEVIQILGYFSVLDPFSLLILVTRPSFWFYFLSSIIAYFLLQSAYSRRRVSVAFPVNNSLSTLVPIIIAVLVFGDSLLIIINGFIIFPISYFPIIGIIAILSGIILLRRFQITPTHSPLETESSSEEEIKGVPPEVKILSTHRQTSNR
jgi:multidrug transporter EmrE-like cation transporter